MKKPRADGPGFFYFGFRDYSLPPPACVLNSRSSCERMPASGSCPIYLLLNVTTPEAFGLWANAGEAMSVARATMVARVFMGRLRGLSGHRRDRVYASARDSAVNSFTSSANFFVGWCRRRFAERRFPRASVIACDEHEANAGIDFG